MNDNYQGYYEQKPQKKGFGCLSVLVLVIIASVVSALIVTLLIPIMVDTGIIKINIQQEATQTNNLNTNNGPSSELLQQQIEITSAIVEAVERAKPTVVGISNIQSSTGFFSGQREFEAGSGSGVIIEVKNNKALIVTNHHVIENARQIIVNLADGEQAEARLVGSDELTDLAVLEIDAKYVTSIASFGDSSVLRPGEPAIAIGNPLGMEFAQTVTVGVVSATERALPISVGGNRIFEINVIQTDAAINFGNSGGALINIRGELIGINSAKIARTGVEGIGFAIPVNEAAPIIDDLIEHGRVIRPYMGIVPHDLNTVPEQLRPNVPVREGVLLADHPVGPAVDAGMQRFDVIIEIEGKQITTSVELRKVLYGKRVGDVVEVVFYRGQEKMTTNVRLGELPSAN